METKLVRRHHIACYNTDQACRLKLAALLDFAQEMAGDHADILEFGDDVLKTRNIAWILSRVKVRMDEYPMWRDDIEIITWHRGLDGPFYIRDYQVRDSSGKVIGVMTTSWLLLDLKERRMVRSEIGTEEEKICREVALEPIAGKIRLPKGVEMSPCGEHVVSYSDIDKNAHTNNVRYTVLALDCLDRAYLTEHPVKEYEINFSREALPGATIALSAGKLVTPEGEQWFVEGTVDSQQSFISRIVF